MDGGGEGSCSAVVIVAKVSASRRRRILPPPLLPPPLDAWHPPPHHHHHLILPLLLSGILPAISDTYSILDPPALLLRLLHLRTRGGPPPAHLKRSRRERVSQCRSEEERLVRVESLGISF